MFGISDLEIAAKTKRKDLVKEALVELVIQHIALLATEKKKVSRTCLVTLDLIAL